MKIGIRLVQLLFFLGAIGSSYLSQAKAEPTPTSVSLEEAFQSAQGRNEGYKQNEERTVQARARFNQALGGLFPQISFSAMHLIQPELSDPNFRSFAPPHQNTVLFTASQTLFHGGQEYSGLSQRSFLLEAQEEDTRAARTNLYQEVAQAYLNVLSYDQDLKNLSEQASIYKTRVSELKARTHRGESSLTELLSAQTTEASILSEIRFAKAQLAAAREQFEFVTGLNRETVLTDPQLLKDSKKKLKPLESYIGRVEQRPDLKAASARAVSSHKGVTFAWGGHLPTIEALGNYYLERPGVFGNVLWDFQVKLTMPIFAGGSTQSAVREAASRRREADLELERTRRQAEQQVRTSYESLSARLEQLSHLEESVKLAEQNVEFSQKDYRRGLNRSIDVQVALADYRTIRRTYDQTRFASQLDFVKLEAAAALRNEDKQQ